MKQSEYLQAMADELTTNGWCQRTMHNRSGEHCLMGAAFEVYSSPRVKDWYGRFALYENVVRRLNVKARDEHGYQDHYDWDNRGEFMALKDRSVTDWSLSSGVVQFNDEPGRTEDDVLAFLKQVIAEARAEGN
jgi:hypothetical protein